MVSYVNEYAALHCDEFVFIYRTNSNHNRGNSWLGHIYLVIIAMFTVTVRRFHDVGMTMLIPILFFLITFLEDINRWIDTDITTMDNPVVGIVLVIVGVIYLVIAIVALVVCCSKGQKR